MKRLQWLVPGFILVALIGLVASTNWTTSAERKDTSTVTLAATSNAPGCCAPTTRSTKPQTAQSGCCQSSDALKKLLANLDARRAAGNRPSSTLMVVSACYTAIQRSYLAMVAGETAEQDAGCAGRCPSAEKTPVRWASQKSNVACGGCSDSVCGKSCGDCPAVTPAQCPSKAEAQQAKDSHDLPEQSPLVSQ